MSQDELAEAVAQPLPMSPPIEEPPVPVAKVDAEPSTEKPPQESSIQNVNGEENGKENEVVVNANVQVNGHEKSPSVAEIGPPSPPTPPAKQLEEVPGQAQDAVSTTASFQDVALDVPPPPIEKSPRNVAPANGHVEQVHSPRPSTPSTSRWFGRKSTSDGPRSPTGSLGHARNLTMSQGNTVSVVLISSALETIAASREARRSTPLKEAVEHALKLVRAGQGGDRPREIFEPLRLACETGNEKLQVVSLDCISKLISYSFFVEPDVHPSQHLASPPLSPSVHQKEASDSQTNLRPPTLVDVVVHTVTACHTETTPDTVSLQIVKALLSLVLSPTLLVHQSSLLKAVRTVYNIFLLSPDPVNQTVAQGGLTQMVNHVFSRCKLSGSRQDSSDTTVPQSPRPDGPSTSNTSRRSSMRQSQVSSISDSQHVPPTPLTGESEETTENDEKEQFPEANSEEQEKGGLENGHAPEAGSSRLCEDPYNTRIKLLTYSPDKRSKHIIPMTDLQKGDSLLTNSPQTICS